MAELRLRTIDEAELQTVIGEDIEFNGKLTVDHPTLVKGRLLGRVESTSDLLVHQAASVEADIQAETLSVRGQVKGKVHTKKRVELYQNARLEAEVQTPDLLIQSGSVFNGTCRMDANGESNAG